MTRAQRRLVIKAVLMLLVIFLLWIILFMPRLKEQKDLKQTVEKATKTSHDTQKMIVTSYRFGERLEDILNQLEYYRNMVPSREKLPEILEKVASQAQENQLHVLSLQPIGEKPFISDASKVLQNEKKEVDQVLFRMRARGNYAQATSYLAQLESAPYAILIKEVVFQNPKIDLSALKKEPTLDIQLKFAILMKQGAGANSSAQGGQTNG